MVRNLSENFRVRKMLWWKIKSIGKGKEQSCQLRKKKDRSGEPVSDVVNEAKNTWRKYFDHFLSLERVGRQNEVSRRKCELKCLG